MDKLVRKKIIIYILIIILIDVIIGYPLFKSRSFSHLAIWNIIESNKKDDFYWAPEDKPGYFRFEPNSDNLSTFRTGITPVGRERDEFEKVLRVARYITDISSYKIQPRLSLRWGSPEEILRQARKGAGANCFYRSILLSTYLSGLGIKSRLWALENRNFNGVSHTVTEVYIRSLGKWVFIDIMLGFYVTEGGKPVSFLELRERLLNGDTEKILVHNINDTSRDNKKIPDFYKRLIRCVFLRVNNDFVNRYGSRYGVLSIFKKHIDKFPDNIRRGLEYWFGGRDVFLHYVDSFSKSLKSKIIIVKLLFYFFIFSWVSMGILLVMFSLSFLKRCLTINLSKKETRHR
jgi:hypothetical protein